ncbi:MAG: hypothetical protein NDJ89_08575 [Oligoflexia bacterium]|nr:hypothetical protein [Oligoflexia bacterium]
MESIRGDVLCDGIRESRALRRFVEKHVRRWLLLNSGTGTGASGPLHYQVTLCREGYGNLVNCRVEIHEGPKAWIGTQYGEGLQQALLRCLERLLPTPPVQRRLAPQPA